MARDQPRRFCELVRADNIDNGHNMEESSAQRLFARLPKLAAFSTAVIEVAELPYFPGNRVSH